MSDLLNDLSTEVIEEVTEAFLNARRAGASKLAAYMIARAFLGNITRTAQLIAPLFLQW